MNPLRIAIISFEHMHAVSYAAAFNLLDGAELVAICDSDSERLSMARSLYPAVPAFYGDYKGMLDHAEIDAVIICTSNNLHLPVALECASRGKHILCEKPLAPTVEESNRIIDAARTAGVVLMTAFPVRFSPAVGKTRQMIQDGTLGKIIGGCSSNHGTMPGSWFVDKDKSGGGAVIDHTVHVVDILRWMLDDEVVKVYAEHATRLHDLQVEDVGQLVMTFGKGAVISLDTSWSRPKSYSIWGDVKLSLKGEKANAVLNCFPQQIQHFDDVSNKHSGFNVGEDLDQLMVQEFINAVRDGRKPAVTGEDGMKAVQVAIAAYEAARTGRAVAL